LMNKQGVSLEIVFSKRSLIILNLPKEIVLFIFGFLEQADLIHSISLTCKIFHLLVQSEQLWKDLCIRNGYSSPLKGQTWLDGFKHSYEFCWDKFCKPDYVKLEDNRRTAREDQSHWGSVQLQRTWKSGKYLFAVKVEGPVTSDTVTNCGVGIAIREVSFLRDISVQGWAYFGMTGSINYDESSTHNTFRFGAGDVVAFVHDIDSKKIEWFLNGKTTSKVIDIQGGTRRLPKDNLLYPTVSLYNAGATIVKCVRITPENRQTAFKALEPYYPLLPDSLSSPQLQR